MATATANGNGALITDLPLLTRKDFVSDQEVRWCPGCGDYSILAQMQKMLPELHIPRENIVFVSGIGCSSRFPYYVETYGFHSIHGRALTLATGLKAARPELTIFVITGDGDGLSIGGNHLLHAMRRNVDLKVILFNNRIYGLTKGQPSPTSEVGKVTKFSPYGTAERPLNPIKIALAAGATFVARSVDRDIKHLEDTLYQAAQHKGSAFVEVYQNCNIFNDGAFAAFAEKEVRQDKMVYLQDGKPVRFGKNMENGIRLDGFTPEIVADAATDDGLLVHDIHANPALAQILSGMDYPAYPVPVGIFRQSIEPTFDEGMGHQIEQAIAQKGKGDLDDLLKQGETWLVS